MIRALLLGLLLAGAPAAPAPTNRLPPVDQCASDASFAAFRTQLRAAVERRDAAFVLSIISDDIMVDFGGGQGRDAFIEAWGLDRPETSALWRELGAVLALGCARDADPDEGESFWMPSLYVQLDVEDPFSAYVAVGPNAVLRSAPRDDAPVVAQLDWDVLTTPTIDGTSAWLRVTLADGRSGYVRRDQVRSSVDYRAGFFKVRGRWRMRYFIAGD